MQWSFSENDCFSSLITIFHVFYSIIYLNNILLPNISTMTNPTCTAQPIYRFSQHISPRMDLLIFVTPLIWTRKFYSLHIDNKDVLKIGSCDLCSLVVMVNLGIGAALIMTCYINCERASIRFHLLRRSWTISNHLLRKWKLGLGRDATYHLLTMQS